MSRSLSLVSLVLLFLFGFSAVAGAYAGDTHYYLRFATALLAGFDWEEAHLIASADYMIDRNRSTHAEKNPAQRHNKANWHAFQRSESRYFELWERVLGESDPERQLIVLGQFLHFAADWEPHGVFGVRLGHGISTIIGHDPDSLGNDAMNNQRMVLQTMDFMMRFRKHSGRPVAGGDPDRALARLFLELENEPLMDELYMINSPRWKTWGVRGKKGKRILSRNHLLIERLIRAWGETHPELKVPDDFTPGDPEKGLPPPIAMSYRKDGEITAVYGVEVELYPEFDGGDFNAALEERFEERVEPEVAEELQRELQGGRDPDLFNIVGTQVLDAHLKNRGWQVIVQVSNFGVGWSEEGTLDVEVVDVVAEETVGHVEYALPRLKGGQKKKLKILVPSEGRPGRNVVIGVNLDGPDLLADDNDDWFAPWGDELEDLRPVYQPISRGADTIVIPQEPKMWVEKDGCIVVLHALMSNGDTSHRLGDATIRLACADGTHVLDVDERLPLVWAATLDLERKTMPAKTLVRFPLDAAIRSAVGSGAFEPAQLQVTLTGEGAPDVTKSFPLEPAFVAELKEACRPADGPAGEEEERELRERLAETGYMVEDAR